MSAPATDARTSTVRNDEQMVLCCSSTRHRRFTDNLVGVMSLPTGSRIRLRYAEDICDPRLRVLGYVPSPRLTGMRALIAHVAFEGGSTSFLPLRIASIVDLRTVGSVTYLEVELSDFVEERIGTSFRDLLIPTATLDLPTKAEEDDKTHGYFCQFLTTSIDLSRGQDTGLWERVASRFLEAISNTRAAFPFIFHVAILHKRSGKPVPLRDGTIVATPISRIEVQIRTLLAREFFGKVIESPIGTLTIGVDHPGVRLASGSQHAIDTTRNLLASLLATNIGLSPAIGSLTIRAQRLPSASAPAPLPAEAAAAAAQEACQSARQVVEEVTIDVPLVVGRFWTRIAAIFFISLAIAVHAFDIGELKDHASYVWGKTAAALLMAGIALFLGLKPQGGD